MSLHLLQVASNGTILSQYLMVNGKIAISWGTSIGMSQKENAVYLGGCVTGAVGQDVFMGQHDVFLMKVAFNGSTIWTRSFGSVKYDCTDEINVDDGSDSVFIAGYYNSTSQWSWDQWSRTRYFVARHDTHTGNQLWFDVGGDPNWEFNPYGMTFDAELQEIWTAGSILSHSLPWIERRAFNGTLLQAKYSLHASINARYGGGLMEFSRDLNMLVVPGGWSVSGGDEHTAINLIDPVTLTLVRNITFGVVGTDTSDAVRYLPQHDAFIVCGKSGGAFPGFTRGTASYEFVIHYIHLNGTRAWTHQIAASVNNPCTNFDFFSDGRLLLIAENDGFYMTNRSYIDTAVRMTSTTRVLTTTISSISTSMAYSPTYKAVLDSETTTSAIKENTIEPSSELAGTMFLWYIIAGSFCLLTSLCYLTLWIRRKRTAPSWIVSTHVESSANLTGAESTKYVDTSEIFTGTTLIGGTFTLSIPAFLEYRLGFDFEMGSPIAKGGQAVVCHAKVISVDLNSRVRGSKVIIKSFGQSVDQLSFEHRCSFEQELSVMHLFGQSPNFVKLYGYSSNPAAIIMKYYEYGDLESFIRGKSHVNNYFACTKLLLINLSKQLTIGIAFMHSKGIAHCDIKPKNLLLDRSADTLELVITDFGIAQVLESKVLKVSAFIVSNLKGATVQYAAPEVLKSIRTKTPFGRLVWKSSDAYSIAMVILSLLIRSNPWARRP